MLIDYVTVTAVLMTVFSIMVVSTGGWEATNTKKGRGIILLVPLLWPIIFGAIVTVSLVFACVFLHVMAKEWMKS